MTRRPKVERPRVREGLELRDLPDGCAVLDTSGDAIHMLNPAAAFILTMCDGSRSEADLALELRSAVKQLSPKQADRDVASALAELSTKGIIEDAAHEQSPARARRGR